MRRLLPIAAILVASACGDARFSGQSTEFGYGPYVPSEGPDESYGFSGDWFPCKDTTCGTLLSGGLRLSAGSVWYVLTASGRYLEPEEGYCWDPDGLPVEVLQGANGWEVLVPDAPPAELRLTDDPNRLYLITGFETYLLQRIFPSRLGSSCGIRFENDRGTSFLDPYAGRNPACPLCPG